MVKCFNCKSKITDRFDIAYEDENYVWRRLCRECFDILMDYELDDNGNLKWASVKELCTSCTLRRRVTDC